MTMKRRDFILVGASVAGICLGLSGCSSAEATDEGYPGGDPTKRWGFVVYVKRFNEKASIDKIARACHQAHNVPTINSTKEEVKWIWEEPFSATFEDLDSTYMSTDIKDSKVPVFCNHCDNPPCVRVCPTKATFKRRDGIVQMDYHRCIGCRFCMAACPYGARSLNFSDPVKYLKQIDPDYPTRTKGVVEKCIMCSERIDKGQKPLCVEASDGSIIFGDLNDPASEVRVALKDALSVRRRENLGTGPSIYYVLEEGEGRV